MVAMPRRSRLFRRTGLAIVLRVGILDAADGADAHAVEVCARFGGIALKVAMQGAIALRDG